MRRYEVVFVLAPGLTEEEVEQQIEAYSKVAKESGANVLETENWGKQRLAYPINKHNDAYYILMNLEQEDGSAISELERRFRVADSVIRFLSVRIDPELKRAEKMERKKEARLRRRAQTGSEAPATSSEEISSEAEVEATEEKEPAAAGEKE